MKTVKLSDQALQNLDRIAKAPSVNAELLEAIGFAPANALRFVRDTGDVPSEDVVAELILASGPKPAKELLELYALTGGIAIEAAQVETAPETGKLAPALVAAAVSVAGLGIRTWRQIRAKVTGERDETDSEIGA